MVQKIALSGLFCAKNLPGKNNVRPLNLHMRRVSLAVMPSMPCSMVINVTYLTEEARFQVFMAIMLISPLSHAVHINLKQMWACEIALHSSISLPV